MCVVCVCVCSVCPLRLTHTTVYTNVLLVFTVHTLVCEHIRHYNLECKGHCCTQWLEQCWIWKYRSMHITLLWKLLLKNPEYTSANVAMFHITVLQGCASGAMALKIAPLRNQQRQVTQIQRQTFWFCREFMHTLYN